MEAVYHIPYRLSPLLLRWINISWQNNGELTNSIIICSQHIAQSIFSILLGPNLCTGAPTWLGRGQQTRSWCGCRGRGRYPQACTCPPPAKSGAPTSIAFPLKSQQSFMFSGLWLFYQVLCSKLSQLLLCLILQLKALVIFQSMWVTMHILSSPNGCQITLSICLSFYKISILVFCLSVLLINDVERCGSCLPVCTRPSWWSSTPP